jgi:hypothetical protein
MHPFLSYVILLLLLLAPIKSSAQGVPNCGPTASPIEQLLCKYAVDHTVPVAKDLGQALTNIKPPSLKPPIFLGGAPVPVVAANLTTNLAKVVPQMMNPFSTCTAMRVRCLCLGKVGKKPRLGLVTSFRAPTDEVNVSYLGFQSALVSQPITKLAESIDKLLFLNPLFLEVLVTARLLAAQRLALKGVVINPLLNKESRAVLKEVSKKRKTADFFNCTDDRCSWWSTRVPLSRQLMTRNPIPFIRVQEPKSGFPGETLASWDPPVFPLNLLPEGALLLGGEFRRCALRKLIDPQLCHRASIFSQCGKYKAVRAGEPIINVPEIRPDRCCFRCGMGDKVVGVSRPNTIQLGSRVSGTAALGLNQACAITNRYYSVKPNIDKWQYLEGPNVRSIDNYQCSPIERDPKEYNRANTEHSPLNNVVIMHWTRFTQCQFPRVIKSFCGTDSRRSCASN